MTELEKIGLIPRSIVRMLDRFYYQLYLGTAEPLVKQFRFSKYLLLTSVKSLLVVLFIPFFINIFTKIYVFRPLVEYFWDRKQTEIFLNYELQEKAFSEIKNFEEKMYFDFLIKTDNSFFSNKQGKIEKHKTLNFIKFKVFQKSNNLSYVDRKYYLGFFRDTSLLSFNSFNQMWSWETNFYNIYNFFPINKSTEEKLVPISLYINNSLGNSSLNINLSPNSFLTSFFIDSNLVNSFSFENSLSNINLLENKQIQNFSKLSSNEQAEFIFRQKTRELAEHYNHESIEAITNLFSDFMGLIILLFLLINMKMSLMNTTAFLSESFFSLKDSKKAFLMLLFTDLLVGFHSPRGWEVIFHFLFEHFGLPENHNIIFLLVGTFPVLLDALFKYWIFRHLNRHSPATVATFQAMVE